MCRNWSKRSLKRLEEGVEDGTIDITTLKRYACSRNNKAKRMDSHTDPNWSSLLRDGSFHFIDSPLRLFSILMTSFNWQSIFYYPLVTVLQRINSDQIFVLSSFVSFTFFIRFTLNWMSSVDAWHLSYIWEGHTREGKCGPYRFVERIYCHVLPSFHSQSVSIFSILSPLRSFFVHTSPSGVFQPRPMISSRFYESYR